MGKKIKFLTNLTIDEYVAGLDVSVDDLVLFPEVAESAQHRVRDLARVLLRDLARLLQHQVEGAAVHVLHADVDLAVAENEVGGSGSALSYSSYSLQRFPSPQEKKNFPSSLFLASLLKSTRRTVLSKNHVKFTCGMLHRNQRCRANCSRGESSAQ